MNNGTEDIKLFLKLMMDSYNNQNERNKEIDNKAYRLLLLPMILFFGEIITSIICIGSLNTISTILFLSTLTINTLSIFYFLRTLNVTNFRELPYNKDLQEYYRLGYNEFELSKVLFDDYDSVIEDNEISIEMKVEYLKKGFLLTRRGLFITLIYMLTLGLIIV